MSKLISSAIVTMALVLSILALPGITYAQNSMQFENGNGPGPGITQDSSDSRFDWRWLLPLAAVPLLFLLFRNNEDTDDGYRERTTTTIAGRKGGRSDQYRDEE